MTQTGERSSFLIVQTVFLILFSLGYTGFWAFTFRMNILPRPEDSYYILNVLMIIAFTISCLWGIVNIIYTLLRKMKIFSVILFWLFLFCSFFALIFDMFVINNIENIVFVSIHAVGHMTFTGFIFSIKWERKLIIVKIAAIVNSFVAILNAAVFHLVFHDQGYFAFFGIYATFYLAIGCGGAITLYSMIKSSKEVKVAKVSEKER